MSVPVSHIRDKFAPVRGSYSENDVNENARRVAEWSKVFMGDPLNEMHYWIKGGIPPVHMQIYRMLAGGNQYEYLTSPREFAKTTTTALVWPIYCSVYGLEPFIIIIGKIDKAGKSNLRNIKRELRNNPKIRQIYGDLTPEKRGDLEWSAYDAKLTNGVRLRSIGMKGNIRGELDDTWRPTLIIVEDPQSIKHIREPETMASHNEYFFRDVLYAIDRDRGKVKVIGNLLARSCLLVDIMNDSRFTGMNFSALVNDAGEPDLRGRSIWEERHPTAELHAERDNLAAQGKLYEFKFERMNQIADEFSKNLSGYEIHDCTYQRYLGQNVLVSDAYPDPIRVNTFLAVDPAYADTKNADERALIVFAKAQIWKKSRYGEPYRFNMLWVLEYMYNHMQPHLIIDNILRLHRRYYFTAVIVEQIGGAQLYEPLTLSAVVQDPFFAKHPFTYTPVTYQPANKKDRIYSGLQPKVKLGQLALRSSHVELMDECDDFESYSSPHLLDALEMGNRYSYECTEAFSNVNQKMLARMEEYDEREMAPKGYLNAPSSLGQILG